MPPRKVCPHCGVFLEDWFREWYPYEEQPKIFQGLLAADCPNPDCLRGVKLTQTVEGAPSDRPVVARSRAAATKWVLNEKRGLYPDLESFLQSDDPAASAYRHYKFRPQDMAMLMEAERRFMDLYLREGFTHDYEGHAHRASSAKGIVYDHYVRLYPFYEETWRVLGEWPDHLPPVPEDPGLPCPWDSKEQLEARIAELESLVSSR